MMPSTTFSILLPVLGLSTLLSINTTRQDVLDRVLGKSTAGGPDANADGIVDASDAVAALSLPPNSLSFLLDGNTAELEEGIPFEIEVIVNAGNEALGSYQLMIRYPKDSLTLTDVFDGNDPFLGQPSTIENRPEVGTLTLAASQFASLEEPTGNIQVARLQFEALSPGTFPIEFVSAAGTDVAQTPRAVESLQSREVTVEPTPPPASKSPHPEARN
ncbi:MAG: hypothetical protein JJU11_02515 [Candidatus Sumerlaeia bacterium]|nr:hypothetical protein [Candidatus Sumerlaeia bacterium]